MFTLDDRPDAIPFAFISGGMHDGQFLKYIVNPSEEDLSLSKKANNPVDILEEMGFFKKIKKKPKATYDSLREYIIKQDGEIDDSQMKELYNKANEIIKQRNGKEFNLTDGGHLQLIPNPDETKREVIFIAGQQGCGKTSLACNYLSWYQYFFKDRFVFIITPDMEDETIKNCFSLQPVMLDPMEPTKTKEGEIVPRILVEPLTSLDFKNSAVMFDDTDYLPDKRIAESLSKTKIDIMGTGRHYNVTAIFTAHVVADYSKTRTILVQAKYIIIFPKYGTARINDYVLGEYLGITDKNEKKRILSCPSRWLAINTSVPRFILHETGAFMI